MAGAMRRMGIYLGLVEDDDARVYGRYDARQSDYPERADDRRYGRYAPEDSRYAGEDGYEDRYGDRRFAEDHYADDELEAEEPPAPREPEPAPTPSPVRRASAARPLGLAPAGATASRVGATSASSPGAGAAGLAVREPVVAAPEPAPAPKEPYRITTVHPRTYNEARQIGERFREGGAVIMNLTELDDADAKRLVDFAAGLIFGLRGTMERVTQKVFLLSPANVDVTAEDKARIAEGGFFNQS
jgi:cell division inhibitor SepF